MTQPSAQLKQNLNQYGCTSDDDANAAQALIDKGVPESGLIDAVRKYGPGIFGFIKLILSAWGVDTAGWQGSGSQALPPDQHEPPAPQKDPKSSGRPKHSGD